MICSPTKIFMDISFWATPGFVESYVALNANHSEGDAHDCALISMPCESNITKLFSVDEAVVFWFDLIVMFIFNNLMNAFGIVGNVISIIIFSKHAIATDSTNSLLLGLAVSDLMTLVVNVIVHNSCLLCLWDPSFAISVYVNLWSYGIVIYRWLNILSLDFVTVISLQRAAAVVLPFRVKTIFSQRNTNVLIILMVSVCLVSLVPTVTLTIPVSFFHHYFQREISLSFRRLIKGSGIYLIKYYTGYLTYRSAVGTGLIFLTAAVTAFKLKSQAKNRASLKATNSKQSSKKLMVREVKVVKLSLTICLTTLVIYTCAIVSNKVVETRHLQFYISHLFPIMTFSLFALFSFNACVNFFIYIAMSDTFRTCCKEMLSLRAFHGEMSSECTQ